MYKEMLMSLAQSRAIPEQKEKLLERKYFGQGAWGSRVGTTELTFNVLHSHQLQLEPQIAHHSIRSPCKTKLYTATDAEIMLIPTSGIWPV